MFVLTIDQVDSSHTADLVTAAAADVIRAFGGRIRLGPDRTAGDEFQVVTEDAAAALDLVLMLARTDRWSIGLGVGPVQEPLPGTTREASGPAFLAARDAVTRAKRAPHRVAVEGGAADAPVDAAGVQALLELLLRLRAGRSAEGWEASAAIRAEGTQQAAAARLGITPQAVSLRVRAAGLREERAAVPAITALLAALDGLLRPGRPEVAAPAR